MNCSRDKLNPEEGIAVESRKPKTFPEYVRFVYVMLNVDHVT
jgi:hypothetical protein